MRDSHHAEAIKSKRPLKVGLVLQHWTNGRGTAPTWSQMFERAVLAESVGFDSLWLVDHLHFDRRESSIVRQGDKTNDRPDRVDWVGLWECWTTLSALASVTQRVQLGTLVTCTAYRNPALLAKMAETISEISGGRLILGLGAGDHEGEFKRFGYKWERRVSQFEEALQIVVPLLKEGQVDFEGEYYSARNCVLRPRADADQPPVILIGAREGSPRMLRLCATHADLWNGWVAYGRSHPDIVPPMRIAVDEACERTGREPASLGRTLTVGAALLGRKLGDADALRGDPEQIAASMLAFASQGIEHLQVYLHPNNLDGISQLAKSLEILDTG